MSGFKSPKRKTPLKIYRAMNVAPMRFQIGRRGKHIRAGRLRAGEARAVAFFEFCAQSESQKSFPNRMALARRLAGRGWVEMNATRMESSGFFRPLKGGAFGFREDLDAAMNRWAIFGRPCGTSGTGRLGNEFERSLYRISTKCIAGPMRRN
jgi:hypothetical protein